MNQSEALKQQQRQFCPTPCLDQGPVESDVQTPTAGLLCTKPVQEWCPGLASLLSLQTTALDIGPRPQQFNGEEHLTLPWCS